MTDAIQFGTVAHRRRTHRHSDLNKLVRTNLLSGSRAGIQRLSDPLRCLKYQNKIYSFLYRRVTES